MEMRASQKQALPRKVLEGILYTAREPDGEEEGMAPYDLIGAGIGDCL
jgi:hypothetical protein